MNGFHVGPITFAPSLRADIRNGRKTATRRVVKASNSHVEPGRFDQLDLSTGRAALGVTKDDHSIGIIRARCRLPAGVRTVSVSPKVVPGSLLWVKESPESTRADSTLTLEVFDVYARRLIDITSSGALEEGCSSRAEFQKLWISLFGASSWRENPWVWVYRFSVHRLNVDEYLKQLGGV